MTAIPLEDFRPSYHDLIRQDVIPHVPNTGGQLLDLGGGLGATARAIRDLGLVDAIGVADIVKADDAHEALDFAFQGDLEDPAMMERIVKERGQFNMILALDILEHLVDPWTMVKRLEAALAPGGVLVTSIPNIRNYTALMPLLLKNSWNYQEAGILDRTHLRFFVRESAQKMVTDTGLKIEKIVPSPTGGKKVKIFRKVTLGLLNSFTDRQYLIVARKS